MGRRAMFSEERILDATLRLVSSGGPSAVTISALGEALTASVGSIYYRFRSRDLVLAGLWLRTVERFQRGFLDALGDDDVQAGAVRAALHTVAWSREHPEEARVLLLYRREDLATRWPAELGAQLAELNADVTAALRSYAVRRYRTDGPAVLRRVTLALVDLPYAATRRHLLAAEPSPPELEGLVVTACRCLLDGASPASGETDGRDEVGRPDPTHVSSSLGAGQIR